MGTWSLACPACEGGCERPVAALFLTSDGEARTLVRWQECVVCGGDGWIPARAQVLSPDESARD
jgi:hypothetical protein